MEDAGQWVQLGPAVQVTREGPHLLPIGEEELEVEDAVTVAEE